jgi:hypothetical protein
VSFESPGAVISVTAATVPLVGSSSPARECMRVDLSEPGGPMPATSWPLSTTSVAVRASVEGSPRLRPPVSLPLPAG